MANTGSLIQSNAMSLQKNIWQPQTPISMVRKRDHDECYKRLRTFVSAVQQHHPHHHRHHHQTKRPSPHTVADLTRASAPNPTFKTRMCSRWLSGCYMGDKCPCAHRIEELFERFYQSEMINFYQRSCAKSIDANYMPRLSKLICDSTCEDPHGNCLFRGNSSMSNKRIRIHMPRHVNTIPYCTITCNTCESMRRIEIYSFCDSDCANKHI